VAVQTRPQRKKEPDRAYRDECVGHRREYYFDSSLEKGRGILLMCRHTWEVEAMATTYE